jgi:hypothetical protein
MFYKFIRSYKYNLYLSGLELVQLHHQNKINERNKKILIDYILNYPNYNIEVLDILKIEMSKKRFSYKQNWKIKDLIIDYSNSLKLISYFKEPVKGA